MKNSVVKLTLLAALMGCGPVIAPSERPQFANGVTTFTFLVYDAFTAAPVNTATIKVTIGGYTLDAVQQDTSNTYVVSQVPPGTHRATIEAGTYLGFVGLPRATCSGSISNPSQYCYVTYSVALYPEAAAPADVTVRVFESTDGTTVNNGTVVATLAGANGNLGPQSGFTDPLPGSFALRPNAVVVPIASGVATLPRASLVLGGIYSIDVFGAQNSEGQYLVPALDQLIQVGSSSNQLTFFLNTASTVPVAVSANTELPISRTDDLQVTFPYPIELCGVPADYFWFIWTWQADLSADGIFTTAPTSPPYMTATLNTDATQLTVTPLYSVQPQEADGLLEIYLDGVRVKVRGNADSTCRDLDAVSLRGGGAVRTRIRRYEEI